MNLAYKNAKNSFTLPGLGKLVLVNRAARIGRNPATGVVIAVNLIKHLESDELAYCQFVSAP